MYCPRCGKENPHDAQICQSCSAVLTQAPVTAERPIVKTSGLAIASLVLGILSVFTCGITAIPAVILGIISLVQIEKGGGILTGRGFAIVGIVVPVVVFLLIIGLVIPAMMNVNKIAFRIVCGTNLSGMGKAMLIYACDYEDTLPRAGGESSTWRPKINNWQANNRSDAYGLTGGADGHASISSSFYLLVKYTEVGPKQFVCKSDDTTEYKLPPGSDKDLIDLWDFGPEPSKHCSYSYHMPYGPYALTIASSHPGMAVAADRNPWIDTHAVKARDFSLFKWDGTTRQQKAGNAIAHKGEGQNVLFVDAHVAFEKRPFCGVQDDNIYTAWTDPRGGDRQLGSPPTDGDAVPLTKADSLLVHDPPVAEQQ